jgi:ribosomal protein L11 methylase PrmA
VENLQRITGNLRLKGNKTNMLGGKADWSSYYSAEHHTQKYLDEKKEIVKNLLNRVNPNTVWDIGANEGEFSKIAAEQSNAVIAFDSDHNCIENCYNYVRKNKVQNLVPLIMDFTNPSPSIGWANSERKSLLERAEVDLVLVLAIIHHLCISNNVPLGLAAEFFSKISKWVIIEFVPKDDPMVKKLLLHREDIFDNYSIESFEKEFGKFFVFVERKKVPDSKRVIYLMKREVQ